MGYQPTGYSEQYGWGTSLHTGYSEQYGGGPIYILATVSSMGGDQPTGYSEQYGWGPAYWL